MKIIFEFAGGPLDGKAVTGIQGEQDEADRYYVLTHHGKIGQRFRLASDYAVEILTQEQLRIETPHHFQPHSYRVTDRLEADDEVLIRAEYVEPAADERVLVLPRETPAEVGLDERIEQRVQEFLQDARRSWTASYSHCWPAEPPLAPSLGSEFQSRHLALHLGHVVLNRNFSVFLDVRHPGFPRQPLDLLALSPGQDWFLACRFPTLQGSGAVASVAQSARQLATFWLGPHLTIPACRSYIGRVARHCQRGYGLVAGSHWVLETSLPETFLPETSDVLDLWRRQEAGQPSDPSFGDAFPPGAQWPSPALLGQFPGVGSCYLLCVYFPLPERGQGTMHD